MRRLVKPFATAGLLICLLACEDRSPPTPIDQSIRPARVMTIELQNQQEMIALVGRVEASQSIDLAFEVAGPLHQLPVREGQQVQQGTLLASLDQSDFLLAVREAQVQLRLAEQDLSRKEQVLARRAIARSVVDDARSMRNLQRVRLAQAQQKLDDATLLAPFDGLVAQRFVDNFVNVNAAQPILRLHANNELFVVANIPEHLSATLTPDDVDHIYCTFAFSGSEKFPLAFRENRGEADRIAQTVEASFALKRSDKWNLMPGMTASVQIELKQNAVASAVVPAAAIVSDAEQQLFVWLFDPNSQKVSRRYVRVGSSAPNGVVVLDGLTDGDIVVTMGAATLREGIRVRPMSDAERV